MAIHRRQIRIAPRNEVLLGRHPRFIRAKRSAAPVRISAERQLLTHLNIDASSATIDLPQNFERSAARYIRDFQGTAKLILADEFPFTGLRRVHSINSNLEDWAIVTSGTGYIITSSDYRSARCVTASGDVAYLSLSGNTTVGHSYRVSFNLTINSGITTDKTISFTNASPDGSVLHSESGRVTNDVAISTGASEIRIGLGCSSSVTNDCDITVSQILIEDVTGQLNKNPNSFIDSEEIYNANVEGVKYYITQNGNTVDDNNVVTSGTGLILPKGTEYKFAQRNLLSENSIALNNSTPAEDWTIDYSQNTSGSGLITISGDNNETLTCTALAGSTAYVSKTLSFVEGKVYVVTVEVINVHAIGADGRQEVNNIVSSTGSTYVDITLGVTGRYGYIFSPSSDDSADILFGLGANGVVTADSSCILTKPMLQEVDALNALFSDWVKWPLAVASYQGYVFSQPYRGNQLSYDEVVYSTSHNGFTWGLGMGDSFANASDSWPQAFDGLSDYSGVFHGIGYIGGTLSGDIQDNWNTALDSYSYDWCVLQGGIYDVLADASLESMQTAVETMVEQARDSNLRIRIINIAPFKNYTSWTSDRQDLVDDYNSWLSTWGSQNNIPIIDVYSALEDGSNPDELDSSYDDGDGLSLNSDGSLVIANLVLDAIYIGVSNGISFEPAVTNIIAEPVSLEDSSWTKVNNISVTDDYGICPEGTQKTCKLSGGSSNPDGAAYYTVSLKSSTKYALRVWIRNIDSGTSKFGIYNVTDSYDTSIEIDWIAGVPTESTIVGTIQNVSSVKDFSGSGYIFSFVMTTSAGTSESDVVRIYVYPDIDGTDKSIELWHIDFYEGSFILIQPVEGIKTADNPLQYSDILLNNEEGSIDIIYTVHADYDVEDIGDAYLVGASSTVPRFLYEDDIDGTISLYDNTTKLSKTINWTTGDRLRVLASWNFNDKLMSLNVKDATTNEDLDGGIIYGDYDGSFEKVGGILNIFNGDRPKILESCRIYNLSSGVFE